MRALTGTVEQQLIYLNTHWGRQYEFAAPEDPVYLWLAVAKFGSKNELDAGTSVELLEKVRKHYEANRPAI